MKKYMKMKSSLLVILIYAMTTVHLMAQEIPLVYDVENTGAECKLPPLPMLDELPAILALTDPFAWSDGSGRDTSFENWKCRR